MKKVILVGLQLPETKNLLSLMSELKALAEALEFEVVETFTQTHPKASPAFWIGKGKVFELKDYVVQHGIECVIFNDELSPVHLRNLTDVLEVEVLDRTMLILEIFRIRAKTKEAMLQVSLAQNAYMLPRIIGSNDALSRQKSGTGSKGPGEKELEMKKRTIRNQMARDRKELEALATVRKTQRLHRKKEGVFQVAIVGYTNSGKSTLLNYYLTLSHQSEEKKVFKKDMLFATLETSARHIQLPDQPAFVMVDTVGFIRQLPHHLVEAFKSTLEEILDASLILHVIDASQKEFQQQMETVMDVLTRLGVQDIPIVNVFNKIDVPELTFDHLPKEGLRVSVEQGTNMAFLTQHIFEVMKASSVRCMLLIPYHQAALLNEIKKTTVIFLPEKYEDQGIRLGAYIHAKDVHRYEAFLTPEKMD